MQAICKPFSEPSQCKDFNSIVFHGYLKIKDFCPNIINNVEYLSFLLKLCLNCHLQLQLHNFYHNVQYANEYLLAIYLYLFSSLDKKSNNLKILRELTVNVLSNEECTNPWSNSAINSSRITERMICTQGGGDGSGRGICKVSIFIKFQYLPQLYLHFS